LRKIPKLWLHNFDKVVEPVMSGTERLTISLRAEKLSALKRDIGVGLKDIEEGRIFEFDPDDIIKRGRQRLAERSREG
jgi:hypothetical protein